MGWQKVLHSIVKQCMNAQVKVWQSVVMTLLISALTGSLGYSVSQMQLANTVAVDSQRITALERIMVTFDARSTEHMNQAIDLFKDQTRVQSEFINAIKVQNELLSRMIK